MKLEPKRPSWDEYFMQQCELVSTRATCHRKHVGAVIVKDKRLVATGYNGSIPGQPHCDDPDLFLECRGCGHKYTVLAKWAEEIRADEGDRVGWPCPKQTIKCLGQKQLLHQGGHDMEDGHCVRTIHAEVNAITQAARQGIATLGATLYCNTYPCWNCFKTIVASGIKEVVYRDDYKSQSAGRVATAAKQIPGFTLRRFEGNPG